MPPKKKGKTPSPIVVGTVSTRSTRRQSVVNIDIPKLTKSKTRRGRSYELEGQVDTNIADSGKLCEKIKATYCKVIGLRNKKESTLSENTTSKTFKKPTLVSLSSMSTDNKELLQILEDWSDEDSQENKGFPHTAYKKHKEFENLEFCAEDINSIISKPFVQDEMHHSSGKTKERCETSFADVKEIERTLSMEKDEIDASTTKNETFDEKELSIGVVEDIDDTDENSSVIIECVTEEIVSVSDDTQLVDETSNLTISEESKDTVQTDEAGIDENSTCYSELIDKEPQIAISKDDSTSPEQLQEEMDITEEIVSPPCEEMLVQEEEVKTNSPGNTPDEEITLTNQDKQDVKVITSPEATVTSDSDSNNQMIDIVPVVINNEETVQSFSTSDSNDSEVRTYFAKEIERNETVHKVEEEMISQLEDQLTGDNFIEESTSNSSEMQYEEIAPSVEEQCIQVEDQSMESEDMCSQYNSSINVDNKNLQQINVTGKNKQILNISEMDKESEKTIPETEDMEDNKICHIAKKDDGEDLELMKTNIEDIQSIKQNMEEFLPAEILTQKVAELNLDMPQQKVKKRNNKKDADKIDSTKQTNVVATSPKKNKNIKKKGGINLETIVQKDVKTKQKKEAYSSFDHQVSYQKTPKTKSKTEPKRKTLNVGLKPQENNTAESSTKIVKTPPPKSKENKSKMSDMKITRKKPPSILGSKIKIKLSPSKKKRKDLVKKSDQQESRNKKEGTKKLELQESKKGKDIKKADQEDIKKMKDFAKTIVQTETQGKEILDKSENENKSETDGDDVERRRSSRIKYISVLKKKTIGHGLVRSKSEISLNESDISDSNSIILETEKNTPLGTPSVSPKTTPRERKTRWSKSMENLVSDVQSNTELAPTQDEINMEIDEKPQVAAKDDPVVQARLKQFVHLKENIYKTSRMTCKEAKKMTCDCFLTDEEIQAKEYGCGEDCLNRLLLIEW